MLQNPRRTLGFKKNMVYKIPPGGGGKPYPASGLSLAKSHSEAVILLLFINPYKHSVLFVGHQQTVQNQTRRRKKRRLFKFSTVCLQEFLLKFE